MKTLSRFFKFRTLTIAFLFAAIFSPVFNIEATDRKVNSADYQYTRISGQSMLPILKNGDIAVIYKAYPYRKIRIGDVVIIKSKRGYNVIHRIVKRYRGGTWVTKGDNNDREDYEVLTKKNFGGLALIGEGLNRYNKYLASIDADTADTAMADINAVNR